MSGIRFESPVWLLLLLPVLALVWWNQRRRRRHAIWFSSVADLKALPVTAAQRVRRLLFTLRLAGLVLLVFALARPQKGLEDFRITTEGIAIQMCLDRSGSMEAMDFEIDGERVDRLQIVKKVFREFVEGGEDLSGRAGDLIGLIAFGGFAEGKCPLTLDHGALLSILQGIEVPEPLLDSRGRIVDAEYTHEELATAIGDAIALGSKRLEGVDAKSKVLILLSDGKSNAGVVTPQAAAEAAKTLGIKIYSIGVGSTGVAPFKRTDRSGRERLIPQRVVLDEATLRGLAETTGGKYFNARDEETLHEVYKTIDRLEKTESEGRVYTEYRELYAQALLPALGLLLLDLLLLSTRFRSLP